MNPLSTSQAQCASQRFTSIFRCPIGWWRSDTASVLPQRPFERLEATYRTVSPETTWKMRSNAVECQCSEYASFTCPLRLPAKSPLSCTIMGVMLADCFHFQVDYITGDANMACYRTGGSKQGSSSIRDSCFQEMVRYYLKAYTAAQNGDPYCCPRAKFTTSNPLTLLRWMEDKFGIP